MPDARVIALALAAMLYGASGARAQQSESPDTGLSDRARCHIAALTAANDPQVACMTECIRTRRGVHIGGGCWHVCYAYRFPLPPTTIFSSCPPDPASVPGPTPEVTCEPRSGASTVEGRIWDDSTGRPFRGGLAFLGPPRAPGDDSDPFRDYAATTRVEADSTGAFVIRSVKPGRYRLRVGAWGRLQSTIDTLVVGAHQRCAVSARLRKYFMEGF